MEGEMKFRHESYGQVALTKCSSNGVGLFGSDIKHESTIRFTVSKSELTREFSEDRYYPYESIVEIEMSANQFSELLTSPNTTGVPCTITRLGNEFIDYKPPYLDGKYSIMSSELESEVRHIESLVNQLSSLLDKVDSKEKLSDYTKKNLKTINDSLKQSVKSNLPFVMRQVRKELDNSVSDALASIEHTKQVKLEGLFNEYAESRQATLKEGSKD